MTETPLASLRNELARRGLHGFIVPRADEHLGEYVPASAERLAWLTGFTGSAGLAVVLADKAAVFTDGRYVLQLASQTDAALWERLHITEQPPETWLRANAPAGARIGFDPWLISEEGLARYTKAGLAMTPVETNPIDAVWTDRPPAPQAPAVPHPLSLAGRSAEEKRQDIAAAAARSEAGRRGAERPGLGRLAVQHSRRRRAVHSVRARLRAGARRRRRRVVHGPGETARGDPDLAGQCGVGRGARRVAGGARPAGGQDGAGRSVRLARLVRATAERGAERPSWPAPIRACCRKPKRIRSSNKAPATRMRAMRWRCAGSCTGCPRSARSNRETEMSAANRLLACREAIDGFRGESFPAISGAGEHGAIIHYRVTEESNRPIRPNEVYLIDSGAQYIDGTTDITRTVWTGPDEAPAEVRANVTRVLKGHIAIATLVFPEGVGGAHIDSFARRALWQVGIDYDHGTGHGVGSYLSVHEGPVSISRLARPVPIGAGHDPVQRAGLLPAGTVRHPDGEPACWCSRRSCLPRHGHSCASRH